MKRTDLVYAVMELGGDSMAVAAKLRTLGIKGRKGSPRCCPIGVYLRRRGFDSVAVGEFSLTADGVILANCPEIRGAIGFASDFDLGMYPELEEAP